MKKRESATIEKIIGGGKGLARLAGGTVALLPCVLPGETVSFRTVRRRSRYLEGEVCEIVEPSGDRREPPCPHFDVCGGCDLQHADYAAQLRIKETILRELLLRGGISGAGEAFPLAVAGAPQEFGYRQRIRLQVGPDGRLGFYRPHSHEVVPVKNCPLAAPAINEVLAGLWQEPASRQLLGHATAVELILSPDDGTVVLLFHATRPLRAADRQQAAELCARLGGVMGILFAVPDKALGPCITRESGPAGTMDLSALHIHCTIPASVAGRPIALTVEPGGFSQVNPRQNEGMIATLLDWLTLSGREQVLDLFCGMGNFSLPLAVRAQKVVGMDLQGAAIRSARRNAEANGLTNCRFEKRGAAEGAQGLGQAGEQFDVVLLDPPRAGCREVIPHLTRLGAGRLVYISCDPATLTRDLGLLVQQGYTIERMQLIDMFPQTHHLETMALLRR